MPTNEGVLEYAAIAAVAFLLGIVITQFCLALRNRKKQEEQRR